MPIDSFLLNSQISSQKRSSATLTSSVDETIFSRSAVASFWLDDLSREPSRGFELNKVGLSNDIRQQWPRSPRVPLPNASFDQPVGPDLNTLPLETWKGVVESVDVEAGTFVASLKSLVSRIPDHTAEIYLSQISEQDKELVREGAVFYYNLFEVKSNGTLQLSEEIRFRRLPNWSRLQVRRIEQDADVILSKLRKPRIAE